MSDVQERIKAADEVFCSSCGAIIKMAAEICPKCGVRQKMANRSSNWFTLFMLSLILGGFGVDRFYVGKIGTGTLKLILSIIAMTLGIVVSSVVVGVQKGEIEITDMDMFNHLNLIIIIVYAAWFIWWLIDFIMVCCGKFTDSKGNAITRSN